MRAEWRRIEADVKLFVKWEGADLYALHEMGYRLADCISDLTPLQRSVIIAVRREAIRQIQEQSK